MMSDFRFGVGTQVMCNLGPSGWKLGRIVALHYREENWPSGKVVPYQVKLESDHALIYVPEDDDRYCREATREDIRISDGLDALAPLALDSVQGQIQNPSEYDAPAIAGDVGANLDCEVGTAKPGDEGYRDGKCRGCDCCPRNWSAVELYSAHYRCASRLGLTVTRHTFDLGTVCVGDPIDFLSTAELAVKSGFMQCPTLVRLPPGVQFSDDGTLVGEVCFDPHREGTYRLEFVAVSTVGWDDPSTGIVRLQINCVVTGNETPEDFLLEAFAREQQNARATANSSLRELGKTWQQWERGNLSNHETCERMILELHRLRALLEQHPRLDGGVWWAQLGGYHMNVHKLLENMLFECELYLGHALTFESAEVRWLAEQNLDGCYKKRLLEAARFMWIEGCEQMFRGEWADAAETLRLAAAKKDGWGWAINFGDLWFSEAAARFVHGVELDDDADEPGEGARWIADAARVLKQGIERTREAKYFGPEGHPWAAEIEHALAIYAEANYPEGDSKKWLSSFKSRTQYWCAQVLGGAHPFPPKIRPRLEDKDALIKRLPGHNQVYPVG